MEETHEFLIPDYFPSFSCKMGSCRTACCEGWPVSVSMENYFRLLGVECKKELRTRLDCGMRIVDHPTPEEYARFNPRYDGNCPMRKTDGRCGLQCELGEDALPDVCFLYPRGVRAEGGIYECSCANSCEAVAELLFNRTEPIAFSKQRLTLRMPPEIKRSSVFETFGREQDIRLYFISVIQNRAYTLPQRFLYLGEVLDRMDNALKTGDTSRVDEILRSGHDDRVFRFRIARKASTMNS